MASNIVVSGVLGDSEDENCKEKMVKFINEKLKRKTESEEVKVAHRLGPKPMNLVGRKPRSRPIVVRCAKSLRDSVFKYTSNLKGEKNENDEYFYVDPQLPEEKVAERKIVQNEIRKIKKYNENKDEAVKIKYEMSEGNLYINKERFRQVFTAPTVTEMLTLPRKEMERILDIPVEEAKTRQEKDNTFYAYAAKVKSRSGIRDLYKKMKLWHPDADHIVMAANLSQEKRLFSTDDGENNAGVHLQKLLENREDENVVVFVAREVGTKLGPKRFHTIKEVATAALNKLEEQFPPQPSRS